MALPATQDGELRTQHCEPVQVSFGSGTPHQPAIPLVQTVAADSDSASSPTTVSSGPQESVPEDMDSMSNSTSARGFDIVSLQSAKFIGVVKL